VHLAFDIFQGMGVAAAVGIRPFLPTLATGALAAGDVEIHFNHTDFSFLQSAPFLLAMAVCAIVLATLERRTAPGWLERGAPGLALATVSLVLGALLFAGSLCRGGYAVWPGYLGGVACAAIGVVASRPLLARARVRLGGEDALLPAFAEASALLLAVLSVVAPPVGPIGVLALLWLLWAGRRREGAKFAGLRILK
jgi:uncharacterized membrane protein YgdD (TMEM256/DUF423 family)